MPIQPHPSKKPGRAPNHGRLIAGSVCALLLAIFVSPPAAWAAPTASKSTRLAPGKYTVRLIGDRLSVKANGADLREVLKAVGRESGVEVTVGPKLKGTVTASFEDLPVKEGLKRLAGSYVLLFMREPGSGRESLLKVAVLDEGSPAAQRPPPTAEPAEAGARTTGGSRVHGFPTARRTIGGVLREEEKRDVEFAPNEVLVKLKTDAPEGAIDAILRRLDATILKKYGAIGYYRLELPPEVSVAEAIAELESDPLVEVVEPNYIVHATVQPNDPSFGSLWGLHNTGQTGGVSDADIDAPEAWDLQRGSASVIVAVIDTGVDYNHPDLAANIWTNPGETPGNGIDDDGNGYVDDYRGWDFYNNDNDPYDDHSHGTHVSGTIAAVGDNGVGVVGVNWTARIMPLKFLSGSGSGYTSDAVEAVLYAAANGAKVMNNSWGGGGYSSALYSAIQTANNAGSLFIAAAGNNSNNNDSTPYYPTNYNVANVVSVAASTSSDTLASFSNWGASTVDLAAPGVSILSTVPGGGYSSFSGTSMATPHVAGAAALLMAQFPSLSHLEIRTLMMSSVDPVGAFASNTITGGRLNVSTPLPCQSSDLTVSGLAPADGATVALDEPTNVLARVTSCGAAVTGATVQASLSSYGSLALLDDGSHGDGSAGDGLYGADWTPTAEGSVSISVTASASGYASGSASATVTVARVIVYQHDDTYPYQWVDATQGTNLGITGDDSSALASLGFSFEFYGSTHTQVRVSSNGYLTFGSNGTRYVNDLIPTSGTPNDLIAPFWDDLNPSQGGTVYLLRSGSAPNRSVTIQWQDVPHYYNTGAVTFQVTLYEGTNNIVFSYQDVSFGTSSYNSGASATVGVESADGSTGTQYSFNTAALSSGLSIRFFYNSEILSVSPAGPVDFGTVTVGGSADQSFTVTNSGGGTLTGTASATAPFAVVSGETFSLSAGASATVVVRLSSSTAQSYSGTITFASNGGSATRAVTGTVVEPPVLNVTPAGPVDFGDVTLGESVERELTVSNTGGSTLAGTVATAPPFAIVSAGSSELLEGLSAYWALDEESGARSDSVGSNNLSDVNTVASAPGVTSGTLAAKLTSANSEFLYAASHSSLQTGDSDWTAAGWVYLESNSANQVVYSKYDERGSREIWLVYLKGADRFYMEIYDGSSPIGSVMASDSGSPSTGQWHFVVAWHDAANNQLGLQIDNGAANTASTSGPGGSSGAAVRIGAYASSPTNFMDGRIDQVGFWKRLLTSDEKSSLYNDGAGLAYPFVSSSGGAAASAPSSEGSYSIAAGASTTVVVRFSPTTANDSSEPVSFASNGGSTSRTATGTGKPTPLLAVSPAGPVDYGTVTLGGSAERSFTVTNAGGSTLSGIASATAPFAIVSGGSYSLAAGASATVVVRFSPTAVGSVSRSVTLTSNGGSASRTVTGTGEQAPALSVSPAGSWNFGTVTLGQYVDRSFTVTNTGGGTLAGSATANAPLSVVNGGSYTLTAGSSTSVVVRFTPTAAQAYSGAVSFTSNGGSASRTVTGTGELAPALSVSPAGPVDFGTVTVGQYADRGFTVTNTGGGTLAGSATANAPLSVVYGGSFSLAAGASTTVVARFTPAAAQAYSGAISFTSNGGSASISATATGELAPALSVSPASSVDLGSAVVGDYTEQSITVTNAGGGTLAGTASTTAPFSVVSGGSYSLAAGSSAAVVVRFTPTAAQAYSGTITLTSDGGSASLAATGTGELAPALSVSPASSLDFGSVTVGGSAERSFTATNAGGGTLTGTASTTAPFSVVSGGSYSLAAGASATVVVRFSPTAAQSYSKTASFTSTAGSASRSVAGTGEGPPALSVSPAGTVDFGTVTLGGSAEQSFTVTNAGGSTLSGIASATAPFGIVSGGSSDLQTDLAAFWSLDESSGARSDSVGGNNLSDVNTVASATGILSGSQAAKFSSADSEYLSAPSHTDLQTGDSDWTVAEWVYLESNSANQVIYSKYDERGSREIWLAYLKGADRFYLEIYDGSSPIGNVMATNFGSPSTGQWHFVVAWHDAANNQLGLQVDSSAANTASTSGPGGTSGAAVRIGAYSSSPVNFMEGRIAQVGFWKRLLTSEERSALYNNGAGIAYPFASSSGESFSLAAGASTTVVVRFTPTAAQAYSETASFASNGGNADRTVTGIGTGEAVPTLAVSPAGPVDFGTVTLGGSSEQSFTVTNAGGGTLSGTASTTAPFSVVSGGSYSLAASASATVVARFTPTAAQAYSRAVAFSSNGGTASPTVTGTGQEVVVPPPALSVSPAGAWNFGTVTLGASADRSFTVTNTGGGTLAGSASATAPFSIVSGGSYSLAAGASATVVVRFTPTAAQAYSKTISFASDGGSASRTVTGTGEQAPALSVSPAGPVDFGTVTLGGSADQSFTVTNAGGGTLSGTASTTAPFAIVSGGSYSLAAGASTTVVARFSPTAAQSYSKTISFASDGGSASRTATGTGVSGSEPPPALAVSPAGTVDFGTVTVGGSAEQSFTVTNTGGGTLAGTVSTTAPFSIVSGGSSDLSTDLAAFWSLDEASGARSDSVGGNNLSDVNTVTSAGGIPSGTTAAQFTAGNSEYLAAANHPNLQTGDSDWTAAGWVYLGSKSAHRVIYSKYDARGSREIWLVYLKGADRFYLEIYDGSSPIGNVMATNFGSPSTGQWHFVVAWHDAANNQLGIQVDSSAANTASTHGPGGTSGAAVRIGAYSSSPTNFMDGRISQVGFWKRLLTPEERSSLYNNGAGLSYPYASSSPSESFSLATGASTTVTVRFTPTVAQSYSETVSFASNGGSANRTVTGAGGLSGAAIIELLSGRWRAYAALSGGRTEGWLKGDMTIDTEGVVTAGSLADPDGLTYSITDGEVSVGEEGGISLALTSSGGAFSIEKASINTTGDLLVGAGSHGASPLWLVMVREAGQLSEADMKGVWRLYGVESGGPQVDELTEGHSWGWWRVGESGDILDGEVSSSAGSAFTQALGQLYIDGDGTFTGGYSYIEGAEETIVAASVSPQNNLAAGVGYRDDLGARKYFLFVAALKAGAFEQADLAGSWQGSAVSSNPYLLTEGCSFLDLELDSDGMADGGSRTDCGGTGETITGDQLTVGADGEVSGQIVSAGDLSQIDQGAMTSTKNEILFVERSLTDGSYSLGIVVYKGN